MINLVPTPSENVFDRLISSARRDLYLCAPYVGAAPCKRVSALARGCPFITLLCDLSLENLISGATDVKAIASLCKSLPSVAVRCLPTLHAKAYISDESEALVTSANMTESGMRRNLEYGVHVQDAGIVSRIRRDISAYGTLGSKVAIEDLNRLAEVVEPLVDAKRISERGIKAAIKAELARRIEHATVEVLRVRTAGRSPHAIFSDAIRYMLAGGSMTTVEINKRVREIHPDLCDDEVERIIDGERFGKLWKHSVRTAQQHLKKRGEIRNDGRLWSLVA